MIVASVDSLDRFSLGMTLVCGAVNQRTQFTKYATFLNPEHVDIMFVLRAGIVTIRERMMRVVLRVQ